MLSVYNMINTELVKSIQVTSKSTQRVNNPSENGGVVGMHTGKRFNTQKKSTQKVTKKKEREDLQGNSLFLTAHLWGKFGSGYLTRVAVGEVTVKAVLVHDPLGLLATWGSALVENKGLLHSK